MGDHLKKYSDASHLYGGFSFLDILETSHPDGGIWMSGSNLVTNKSVEEKVWTNF
ncbi:hypothetical protein YDYSG_27370 [Paenibacillus tyrfis]|nr:hypothetical protein YDYSG_27370 [Paenibacillus tyrfis]